MKSFWIYILAFFPFQVSGILNASTIQPGFLADQHAKTINSSALDSEEFLKSIDIDKRPQLGCFYYNEINDESIEWEDIVGNNYNVLTIEEQHSDLYKILKTEKLIVFIIFSFILIISSFNIFFLLSMHAIDKKRDLSILLSLGFTEKSIKKIFYYESMIISILGIIIGGALGVLLCVLQNEYGLVSLGMETAIIKYYPVKVKLSDILIIVSIVFFISIIASIKPSLIAIQKINLNLLNNK